MHRHNILPHLALGILAGAAIGVAAAGMTGRNGKKIRRQAERAARTVSDFARDLSGIIRD